MGLVVPWPDEGRELSGAGYNGNGEFLISGKGFQNIYVPDEWRVPLAAHLLSDVKWIDPKAIAVLRTMETKARRKGKAGKNLTTEDADALGAIAHSLECLVEEFLNADPRTSVRYEYRPSYYDDVLRARGWAKPIIGLKPEEMDDTPMPWEKP
jgi:hypothetical protein